MSSRTLVSACFLILVFVAPAVASYGWWGTRGPHETYVRDLLQGRTRIVALGSGLQESADGLSWRPIPAPGGERVFAAAMGGDVLFVATSQGVYRRVGASAWQRSQRGLPAPLQMLELAADAAGTLAGIVIRSVDSGRPREVTVFRSIDAGSTWSQTTSTFDDEPRLVVTAGAAGRFLLATASQLYRSIDGGLTWGRLPLGSQASGLTAIHAHAGLPALLFVGTQDGMLRSTDGGATWTSVMTLPQRVDGVQAVVSEASIDRAMFATADRRLFVSSDQGATWAPASSQPPVLARSLAIARGGDGTGDALVTAYQGVATASLPSLMDWRTSGFGAWFTGVREILTTPTGLIARGEASNGVFWMSRDRARTWLPRQVRLSSGATPFVTALVTDPASADRLVSGAEPSDAGVLFASDDGGLTWRRRDTGLPMSRVGSIAISPHNAGHLLAATLAGIYISVDGGLDWKLAAHESEVGWVTAIVFDPAVNGVVYAAGRSLLKSEDGGRHWQALPLQLNENPLAFAVDPDRPHVLYAAHSRSRFGLGEAMVQRSVDGGRTWTPIHQGLPSLVGLSMRQIAVHDRVPYLITDVAYRLEANDEWRIVTDLPVANNLSAVTFDRADRGRMYVGTDRGVFAEALRGEDTIDTDGDGLPDVWESRYQLDVLDPTDADADADGDGRTNLDGYVSPVSFRHPRGHSRVEFAEGVERDGFSTRYALFNAGSEVSTVVARFVLDTGRVVQREYVVAPHERRLVEARSIPELLQHTFGVEFASDEFLAVERHGHWANGRGAHLEVGQTPSRNWYFAEGATHSGFNVFYAISNQHDEAVQVFLRPLVTLSTNTTADPLDVVLPRRLSFAVPPHTRATIWLNELARTERDIDSKDLGAHIEATRPIVAERVMYLDTAASRFGSGTVSAGVSAPATRWSLAEGATGDYFDEFLLMANPTWAPSTATVTFTRADGVTATKAYVVPPFGRVTVWVDQEQLDSRGALFRDAAVSIDVEATIPIVVERAMWWPGPTVATWAEAHVSAALPAGATRWLIADAEVGGAADADTFILIKNASAQAVVVRVVLVSQERDGVAFSALEELSIGPRGRVSASIRGLFSHTIARDHLSNVALVVSVSSNDTSTIVVERATYSDADGQRWRAGSAAAAVPVP